MKWSQDARINSIMLGFADAVSDALGGQIDRVVDPLPHAVTLAHNAAAAGEKTDKSVCPSPDMKYFKVFLRGLV